MTEYSHPISIFSGLKYPEMTDRAQEQIDKNQCLVVIGRPPNGKIMLESVIGTVNSISEGMIKWTLLKSALQPAAEALAESSSGYICPAGVGTIIDGVVSEYRLLCFCLCDSNA